MRIVLVLSALVALSTAFRCHPNACDDVKKPVFDCPGGITKGSGWCGCTDSCAVPRGSECRQPIWSIPSDHQCDEGLVCIEIDLIFKKTNICLNATEVGNERSKRSSSIYIH